MFSTVELVGISVVIVICLIIVVIKIADSNLN